MENLYITQQIPNKVTVLGEIEQKVVITSLQVNWQSPITPQIGLPQIIVGYELLFEKDGANLNSIFKDKIEPKRFDNSQLLYQRSFDPETLFQPLENPDFIEGESPEEKRYLTMGAFDFIVGEIFMKYPQYMMPFLKMYIMDNYEDGWYDSIK